MNEWWWHSVNWIRSASIYNGRTWQQHSAFIRVSLLLRYMFLFFYLRKKNCFVLFCFERRLSAASRGLPAFEQRHERVPFWSCVAPFSCLITGLFNSFGSFLDQQLSAARPIKCYRDCGTWWLCLPAPKRRQFRRSRKVSLGASLGHHTLMQ